MIKQTSPDPIHLTLAGIFITNALLAEIIGGKLIEAGPFTMSIGVLPWPVVFLTTDLLNEFYGRKTVKQITIITVGLIMFTFLILQTAMLIPAASFSPVQDPAFNTVFGQSTWIIGGSIIAFVTSQYTDLAIFAFFKKLTGDKMIWLRATGSTMVSQLVDTIMILGIAFYIPGKINTSEFISLTASNYSYKILIAILLIPLIYLGHYLIKKYRAEPVMITNEI